MSPPEVNHIKHHLICWLLNLKYQSSLHSNAWCRQILFLPLTPFRTGRLRACQINEKKGAPFWCVCCLKSQQDELSGVTLIVMGGRRQQFSYSGRSVSVFCRSTDLRKCYWCHGPWVHCLLSLQLLAYIFLCQRNHAFCYLLLMAAHQHDAIHTMVHGDRCHSETNTAAVVDSYWKGMTGLVLRWDDKTYSMSCRRKPDLLILKVKKKSLTYW